MDPLITNKPSLGVHPCQYSYLCVCVCLCRARNSYDTEDVGLTDFGKVSCDNIEANGACSVA